MRVIHGNPLIHHHDGQRPAAFQSGFRQSPPCRQPNEWRTSSDQPVEIPARIGTVCSRDIPLDENPETNAALNSVSTGHGFNHCYNLHRWHDHLQRAVLRNESIRNRTDDNRHHFTDKIGIRLKHQFEP